MLFACFSMLPVLITAFILTYESMRDKWYMKALFYLSVGNFLIQQLLQITGLVYYMQMITDVYKRQFPMYGKRPAAFGS